MSPLLRRLASPRLSLQTHRPLCPDVITSAAHRKSVFSSISLPPKFKLFRRKVNQASSQFAHRPSLGTMKCSFTVPMPASVYLRRLQTGSTDTSFRCVALFPAETTSFWPSEGKGTLFNVAAFHLRSLPQSLRQTKHTPWFYCCQQRGQTLWSFLKQLQLNTCPRITSQYSQKYSTNLT